MLQTCRQAAARDHHQIFNCCLLAGIADGILEFGAETKGDSCLLFSRAVEWKLGWSSGGRYLDFIKSSYKSD